MPEWLRDNEAAVLQRIAEASAVFCFLDYDGTLAPLAPTPEEARPLAGTAALLAQLAAAPGVQVAVVTGRPVADVRRFVDVSAAYYVGIHGLEIRSPSGATQVAEGSAVVRSLLPGIKRRLQQTVGAEPGILFEDKGAALACHYRLASPAHALTARQAVSALVRTYQRRGVPMTLTYGHEVAEIRPAYANKGKTVCALLAVHAPAALPVYIGDDQTDEDAFNQLPPPAITIRVGPADQPTRARYRVSGPDEVHRFLCGLLASRGGPVAADTPAEQVENPDRSEGGA